MPSTARSVLVLALAGLLAACTTGSSGAPSDGGEIEITAVDDAFEPSELEVTAGRVALAVENVGAEEHEFEILDGEDVVDEIEGLVPGLRRTLTVDLAAGTYTYVCRLADHEARGMVGTLTVVAP